VVSFYNCVSMQRQRTIAAGVTTGARTVHFAEDFRATSTAPSDGNRELQQRYMTRIESIAAAAILTEPTG